MSSCDATPHLCCAELPALVDVITATSTCDAEISHIERIARNGVIVCDSLCTANYATDGFIQQMQTQIAERPQNQVSAFVLIEIALLEV